ncbi:transposon Tf2-6 polyprotein [Trichonephila clavipes]|nr:transposon Tf2-6 polyprotein [Trichonephila clavipes]
MLNEDSKNLEMSAVNIKIPAFWTERPEIWFHQVEAQIQISRISLEETKFHYLVSQLQPKYVENIWDIVNSKSDTKYTDSKNRLLSLFKESENLRIKRLLTGIELGDMKPSQLLQKLKTVATSDISENLIKTLWLEKLPESIKNILVVSDENLSKLASAVNIATNSTAEDYKACRKFRLFVKDRTTNLHFLVDSGADCSIIPATSKNKQPSDYKLFAANGTEIPTYGIKVLNIDLELRREFLFPFIIAKKQFPLPDCKAETASKAFYEHWVCRFGVPGKIITDQGRQFESQLFRSLAAICGAKVAHATSYYPQCNGKVKRLHRTLKRAIKAHNIKWTETLPTVLLGLRTALRPDTNHTIAQMVYGSNIRLPGEFFNPPSIQIDAETFVTTLQTFMDELKPTKTSPPKSQKIFVHKDLKSCTHVFVRVDRVRKALEPPYDGPFPVKERYEKYFTLTIKNKPVNISVDRLKPAYLLMTDSIPDKTTVPCKQSDKNSAANDTNLLTHVKPTFSRHGRLLKKPVRFQD